MIFGWHDDVVETGCGWHDGDNADHANCIFQICSGAVSFNNVNVKSSSRCSPVDILIQELNHTNPKTPLKPSVLYKHFMWNRALATVSCAFCRANSTTQIQSCSKRDIFYHFYVKTSSCYSLMQILLDLIFQKHSEHVSFLTLLCEIELSLQSGAHFANLVFQKVFRTCQFFFNIFIWNQVPVHNLPIFQKCSEHDSFQHFRMQICKSRSRYSPVHCSSTTFADRGLEPRKQRPYFGDHGSHFTRKKHTVSRPRWIQAFPGVTSQLLDDDVVDMML